ncbi:ATP-dependent dethiobiotin synthetase BioD [Streptomyces griseolus]|uniref:ATP-dependent dethiobiotin synthetase BioD n=1 Tax=Streptomyces griseolus TaxID=1909 RepID=UPI000A889AE8|nr:dethiobiotin synthase [Streptomyces griseolus]
MTVLVVSGTGTEIGKTVVTAAVAAAFQDRRVAVLKPAQTGLAPGEPGDAAEAARLAGAHVTAVELARFPEPLAPETAARRAGLPPVRPYEIAEAAQKLATEHDLVLVEGAGGLLVRYDGEGSTLADAARLLAAPVLIVAPAGLAGQGVSGRGRRDGTPARKSPGSCLVGRGAGVLGCASAMRNPFARSTGTVVDSADE